MEDLHKIFSIDGLEPEQQKALAYLFSQASNSDASNNSANHKNSMFINLMALVVAVLTSGCIAGLLYLFAQVGDIGAEVNKIGAEQSKIFDAIQDLKAHDHDN